MCLCVFSLAARTRDVMKEFGDVYEQQYAVALFNSVRFEIEGGGGKQSQLLHRKASACIDYKDKVESAFISIMIILYLQHC